ncbi:hypothetical protein QTO34_012589 [Cnephaeus nilssonii]|uniref:Uncharacterized protein n=1 Tax=Cnephaeus nilssonii TaxID=3371016 RepID=A0AA40HBI9_CNENI|nr:hypothetical protein QTO34_012589 [Eptesicus nilssonii]
MQVLEEPPGAVQGEHAGPLVSSWTCGLTCPRTALGRAPGTQNRVPDLELRGRRVRGHLFGTVASLSLAPVNIFQVVADEERAETGHLSSFIGPSLRESW